MITSTVSRQRLWQREMNAKGLCCQCAKPVASRIHCEECRDKARERSFARSRILRGVPLDFPKWARYGAPAKKRKVSATLDRHLSRIFGEEVMA